MWNALQEGFEPQPGHYIITQAQVYPKIPKVHPRPAHTYKCEGGPIHPFIAYQGAKTKTKTLCIFIIWMWNTSRGV